MSALSIVSPVISNKPMHDLTPAERNTATLVASDHPDDIGNFLLSYKPQVVYPSVLPMRLIRKKVHMHFDNYTDSESDIEETDAEVKRFEKKEAMKAKRAAGALVKKEAITTKKRSAAHLSKIAKKMLARGEQEKISLYE